MAVLVTVGAGRIGSHAAPHLVKRDKEVTVRILTLDGIRECGQANVCVESGASQPEIGMLLVTLEGKGFLAHTGERQYIIMDKDGQE